MDFQSLMITTSKSSLWELIYSARTFHIIVVLSCIFFGLPIYGQCSVDGMQNPVGTDDCRLYADDSRCGSQDSVLGNGKLASENPTTPQLNYAGVCSSSPSFCFPSTLSGFSSKKSEANFSWTHSEGASSVDSTQDGRHASSKIWLSDHGIFELFEGEIVSCSLNSIEGVNELSSILKTDSTDLDLSICREPFHYQKSSNFQLEKDIDLSNLSSSYSSLSPHVNINPTVLDWGQNPLYIPSLASLTVENTCSDSVLHINEPFSTDSQFYPCNFSEALLGPGEITSICFVFLPRWLGVSSGHLILQTNFVGFLVQTKGFAFQSPYRIQPLVGQEVSGRGIWIKNLSLFNPFDEHLYVEKIAAWILFSQGDAFRYIEATCSVEKFRSADDVGLSSWKDWLLVESSQMGRSALSMRPYMHWKIGPHSDESIIEIVFSLKHEEKIGGGAVCIQLLRSSQNKHDTILIPVELNIEEKMVLNECEGFLSVSLEPLVQYENVYVTISVKNNAPHVLSAQKILKITDGGEVFPARCFEGLLLFPGTTTQVAMIDCSDLNIHLDDILPELIDMYKNCKLLFVTNDSSSSHLEVHCQDVIHLCSRYWKESFIDYGRKFEHFLSDGSNTGSLGSFMQLSSQIKVFERVEHDELVLENWKLQGTTSNMSLLDEHELSFAVVEVGSYCSRWITLKNPSERPVIIQLLLNSLEIIDECEHLDGYIQPPSGEFIHVPSKYGFSIEETALTEAFIHPQSTVSLGPIFFYPSNRCGWRSSAMIRNNLSGIEWLSLRGYGGSLSLLLFEGSQPVKTIEFHLDFTIQLNISFSEILLRNEKITHTCSKPLFKELYAKNVGDIPLKVWRIEIARNECGSDGFIVHDCKAFALEPGESKKLLISYRTDFLTVMMQRDLELTLVNGMLVVPIRVSIPSDILSKCTKSVFWDQLKKFSISFLILVSLIFAVFRCFFPHTISLNFLDYSFKSGKTFSLQHNQGNNKIIVSTQVCSWFGSNGKAEGFFPASDSKNVIPNTGLTTQCGNQITRPAGNNHVGRDGGKERLLQASLSSKSKVIENSDIVEANLTNSLTVCTENERGRRHRKRKGSGRKLSGLFEVASSQSGNSTPSSPLSPVSCGTPKRTWPLSPTVDRTIEIRNPFEDVEIKCQKPQSFEHGSKAKVLKPEISGNSRANNDGSPTKVRFSESRKSAFKPVLLPSATFPSAGKPSPNLWLPAGLVSTSKIAPHARAPGSKLLAYKAAELEENERVPDEYTYDIWADHLSGLRLMSKSNDGISSMISSSATNDSDSFFVTGPPIPAAKNQSITVSSYHQNG